MSDPSGLRFRMARPDDARAIARLQAGSWRRHYRGAYSDEFLAVLDSEPGSGLFPWVLEQNSDGRAFYAARGGRCVERDDVPPPGGDPARLNGRPTGLRYAWPDGAKLLQVTA